LRRSIRSVRFCILNSVFYILFLMNESSTIKSSPSWRNAFFHLLAWIGVFSLPYLLRLYDSKFWEEPRAMQFFLLNNLTTINWVIIFYLNIYILIPRFLYTKKYGILLLSLAGLFAMAVGIHFLLFSAIISDRPAVLVRMIGFNLPPFVMTVAASIAYRMIADKSATDRLLHEKQEENLKSELLFLRSQISPHFMFNVLNNMLAMARSKSEQLEPTILKLSSLMRYILYESDDEKVSIKKEADYLQSYIDLQKQRIGAKVLLDVNINLPDNGQEIAPMLLIPFIENAFKHGTSYRDKPEIHIDLNIQQEFLYFTTRNRYNPSITEIKDKTSGIGLANVKRRLNLLYPERHNLLITDNDNWFTVSLQLNLADHVKMHSS
jgi:two-component system LytT family sensor kinase